MSRRIRVLLFGPAREAAGRAALDRVLEDGQDLEGVLEALRRDFPRLTTVLKGSRVAVNGAYVEKGTGALRPDDEVAIHPPYSGG